MEAIPTIWILILILTLLVAGLGISLLAQLAETGGDWDV